MPTQSDLAIAVAVLRDRARVPVARRAAAARVADTLAKSIVPAVDVELQGLWSWVADRYGVTVTTWAGTGHARGPELDARRAWSWLALRVIEARPSRAGRVFNRDRTTLMSQADALERLTTAEHRQSLRAAWMVHAANGKADENGEVDCVENLG